MPKRPKGVEAIPAAQWGQIASKLQAEGVGGPDVTEAIDKGDGVKALARWTRRRLKLLRNGSKSKREKPLIPRRLRQEAHEGLIVRNEEELELELEALKIALAANRAFQDPLYYEREAKENLASCVIIGDGNGNITLSQWRTLSDTQQLQIAALSAADHWCHRPSQGQHAITWAQNLLRHRNGKLWWRHVEYSPFVFVEAIREFDEWPHNDKKGLGAYLGQLAERLTEYGQDYNDPLQNHILNPIAQMFLEATTFGPRPYEVKDFALGLTSKIRMLQRQLEGYVREQLVNGKKRAEELLTSLPNPATMPHDDAIELVMHMMNDLAIRMPNTALEASAEDHVTSCSSSWCAPLHQLLTDDCILIQRKVTLIHQAHANLQELRNTK